MRARSVRGDGLIVTLTLTLALAACHDEHNRAPNANSDGVKREKKTGAVASDMCAEHGVLEAICTKCHPTLIPVFQAKGDWCEEHGFPESVCPICHPERGGRPKTDVTIVDDGAPADGTKVKLKDKALAARVRIETVKAESRAH